MGLFKNIGRKVEEFKQASESVAADEAGYECSECGKLLYTSHDECPDCGGPVVPRDGMEEAEAERNDGSNEDSATDDE